MGGHQLELVPLAAVSGLVDVDPITLSAARLSGATITPQFAATIIMIAAGANLVFKSAVAVTLGSRALAAYLVGAGVLAAGAAALSWALLG